MDQRIGVARLDARHIRLEPFEKRDVANRGGLDDLGETCGQLAIRQGREAIGVDQHGTRLVERPDHVLAERMIDAGLAADRRIHLRQQRGRHLHERHPALVDGRGETGEVADDAAPERHERRRALRADLEEPRQQVVERRPRFVRLAVRNEDRLARNAGCGQAAWSGGSQCAATTGLLTITTRGRGSSGASSAPASRSRPAPDVDRVAALAQRNVLRCRHGHRAPSGSGSTASSSREKRAISSRLDSMTVVATSRYSGSRAA